MILRAQKRTGGASAVASAGTTTVVKKSEEKIAETAAVAPDRRLEEDVLRLAGEALRIPQERLNPTENLSNFGVDSIAITEVMVKISRCFGISVAPTTFFEAKHLDDLAAILRARYGAAINAYYAKSEPSPQASPSPVKTPSSSSPGIDPSWLRRHRAVVKGPAENPSVPAAKPVVSGSVSDASATPIPIAVISMEGMFAQSPDLVSLEAHLANGDDCIEDVPWDRWDWQQLQQDPKNRSQTALKYGGFVPGHDQFDAAFFNLSPREAELMDPQHRLFMMCVWKLIEKAGYAPGSLAGRKIGIFLGINLLDYVDLANRAEIADPQKMTGLGHVFCPNRLSFLLDVHGPSQVVDTACSSSLVAIHRAVMSIRHEGCEMAIAGGSNLMLTPTQHILFSKIGMLAPDGRSKSFSAHADGYGRSDGVGAVLLKRLDRAEADGDTILGVITASVEHHGGQGSSLTAPNPKAQAALIVEAHQQANIDPRSIGYVECHGTGTPLGDPIEAQGLKAAFDQRYQELGITPPQNPHVGLGSIKSNIGHAETAAGVAGLIKVLLSMESGTLYQSLHCEDPNPLLELTGTPFYLLEAARPWSQPIVDGVQMPRRAGLSSFGAGGSNVHVIVEEYLSPTSTRRSEPPSNTPMLFPISAKNDTALKDAVAQLRSHVGAVSVADLAYTLQVGRDAMRHRLMFVAANGEALLRQMDAFLQGDETQAVRGTVARGRHIDLTSFNPVGVDALSIAQRWVDGETIAWASLYPSDSGRIRLPLPTYPFQCKRFWLPCDEPAQKTVARPLTPRADGEGRFVLTLTGAEFFLRDHRVMGRPVLPGVGYLEIARAVAKQLGFEPGRIEQVVWLQPLFVECPVNLEIVLDQWTEQQARLRIYRIVDGDGREEHAQMRVAKAAAAVAEVDLSRLQATHSSRVEASRVYQIFDQMGLNYGPSHRAVQWLAAGQDEGGNPSVLARLALPTEGIGDAVRFDLHPSLMDGAFQAAVGMALPEDGTDSVGAALPFALASVEQLGACEQNMWAYVRTAADQRAGTRVLKTDIDLIADDGSVRVRLRGFAARTAIAKQTSSDISVQTFTPRWQSFDPHVGKDQKYAQRVVLVADGLVEQQALAVAFEGENVQTLADETTMPLAERYTRLAEQVLSALQGLAKSCGTTTIQVQLVLPDGEGLAPLSGLIGMLRSAGFEYPNLSGQVILVQPGVDPLVLASRLAAASSAPGGALLRVDPLSGALQVEGWGLVAPSNNPTQGFSWRPKGIYLITGGSGGLGRLLTQAILHVAPEATVVLASRSRPQGEGAAWLARQNPERVHHMCVDLADDTAVMDMMKTIRQHHHHLHGVFHAAGVLNDSALANKQASDLRKVLSPKVVGTCNLDQAIGDEPLDFLVLFSSIAASLGSPGQSDYAAANGFLDGYAVMREARRKAGLCQGRTHTIAWPFWRDGGMAMDSLAQAKMTKQTGLVALESADGIAALTQALSGDAPRLLVVAGQSQRVRHLIEGLEYVPNLPLEREAKPTPNSVTVERATSNENLPKRVLSALERIVSDLLKVDRDELDPDVELPEYGFDSISFTQFAAALNDQFDLDITPTIFFECPTLALLSAHLCDYDETALRAVLGGGEKQTISPIAANVGPRPPAVKSYVPPLNSSRHSDDDAIAIIGMSGQFPQAPDLDTFWRHLATGHDAISEIPSSRWNWRDYWGDPSSEPGRCKIKWGGFLDNIAAFDPDFFGISRPEARYIDPQQRLLLTQVWRLMEDAGYAPSTLSGSDTGLFIGTGDSGYGRLVMESTDHIEGYAMTGLAPSLGPNRVSYFYNLHGPSMAVETACSSALVAVHRAVEAIQSGHCRAAFAGGINTLLVPDTYIGFAKAGMLSPTGRCHTFSAEADGYVRGEGVGLVFLKRLSDAERDGDRILALIRASGENHGGRASSLTAPNPNAQADLLRTVYRRAGFDPRTVGYIEAHGTGTPLGDPIETEALKAAFADLSREAEEQFGPADPIHCGLGSVKSNIGHLELAAGIAGLIKTVLQMRHAILVESLHAKPLNPYLKLDGSGFEVVGQSRPWPRRQDGAGQTLPYRAGVSSFGFGGSNAHVVVEEYIAPAAEQRAVVVPPQTHIIILSARTEAQLREAASQLSDAVAKSNIALADLAYTLQFARDAMEHRLAFTCASRDEVLSRLGAFLDKRDMVELHLGQVKTNRNAVAVLQKDETLSQAVAGLADRGHHDDLLELWVRGFNINWRDLQQGSRAKKVSLPGYPFSMATYWGRAQGGGMGTGTEPTSVTAPMPQPSTRPPAIREVNAEYAPEKTALSILLPLAAQVLEVDASELDVDVELGEFGFDSIVMTTFANRVNDALKLTLSPADFFEYATLNRLAAHVSAQGSPVLLQDTPQPTLPVETPIRATAPLRDQEPDPLVIVGYSCHFPGARDADAFWQNLIEGKESLSRIPLERWDWHAYDGDPKTTAGKTNVHWGGFIDGVFEFDPLFFNISPREALFMDPQQRLLMMHAWNAIESAGHAPTSLAGKKVGVFIGTAASGYRDLIGENAGDEGYVATGSVASVGPNRLSYFLDLHGPSEPVETACSSSLVALHRAVQSIRNGECDMALVGGINTILTPEAHIQFSKAGMLSLDGRCKTFSNQADGYGRGEGAGVLFIKRRSAAERDGDPIRAIIRGSGINHGGRANSLTAPNTVAQADLLRGVYADAGINPRHIGYVEAHGTGTALGDPVEINALKSAFGLSQPGSFQAEDSLCSIGSVKTNIGHLELAAGVAGIIKVLLQLEHRTLVPSLHCDEINPHIQLAGTPFEIVRTAQPWQSLRNDEGQDLPRLAGISSFGFGGVNAHVVLEEYRPSQEAQTPEPLLDRPGVFVLSGRDAQRLKDRAAALFAVLGLGRIRESDRDDLSYTLQVGRTEMSSRLAIVASTLEALRDGLKAFLSGQAAPGLFVAEGERRTSSLSADDDPSIVAQTWVNGAEIDWSILHTRSRRRLVLPVYPFARDTYRVSSRLPSPHNPSDTTLARDGSKTVCVDADAFYMRDHRVRGQRVLPGAMSLELVRAAFVGAGVSTPISMHRIAWRRPLTLDVGHQDVVVDLGPATEDGTSFSLLNKVDGDLEYVRGVISRLDDDQTPPAFDLGQIRSQCPRSIQPEWLYDRYAALGLEYGPAFRVVEEIWTGDGQILARLRLPDAAKEGSLILHPSLLDGAFHVALGLFEQEERLTAALPVGLDSLQMFAPTTDSMWVWLRLQPQQHGVYKFDLDLADEDGQAHVAARGFTLRPLAGEHTDVTIAADVLQHAAERYFKSLLARLTDIAEDQIELGEPLERYGIDSLLINRLTDALEKDFGPLSSTLFFEYRTLQAVIDYFMADHAQTLAVVTGVREDATPFPSREQTAVTGRNATASPTDQPIAIIGMAGRYPGADSLEAFWKNLAAGRDGITDIPVERWDHAKLLSGQIGRGGFVDGFDCFDPLFFNISPAEAEYMDPQERLFLQCAWETLEDAGYTRSTLAPARQPLTGGDVGVFVGVMWQEYQLYGAERSAQGQSLGLTGNPASIANRVSYFCDFHGPSLAVDSMCSSSLTAIHLACESLRSGSCQVALAGGVNLSLHPNKYIVLGQGNFLSDTGRCESFGQGGNGYVPGEGVGAVLLKPLDQAITDGDRIQGVIRATALNHGGMTNGYTVPNPDAQAAVIGRAMDQASVSPESVSYVEAHGTGTSLGDPIEIRALSKAYRGQTDKRAFCAIGSVKSNIGHLESASGIAGLTKVLLQFKHGQLAPSLHSETLNPHIDFASSPFTVQQRLAPWPQQVQGGQPSPRIAGLSSFGAGGSNAHVILQEYIPASPEVRTSEQVSQPMLFPVSAQDPERLMDLLKRLQSNVRERSMNDLEDVAYTLQVGREAFDERLVFLASTKDELLAGLDQVLAGETRGNSLFRGRAGRGQKADVPLSASLSDIAQAWVNGATVNWRRLWQGVTPRRIALPSYPFARDRYWVPEAQQGVAHSNVRADQSSLPLFFVPDWRTEDAWAMSADEAHERDEQSWLVLCELPDSLADKLAETASPAHVVRLQSDETRDIADRFVSHASRLMELFQSLMKAGQGRAVVQVVVTEDNDGRLLAGLGGMLRTASQEAPSLSCQLVVLTGAYPDHLGERLRADRMGTDGDGDIRYQANQRMVRRWREVSAPRTALVPAWKKSGVYLITGGAGGVGLEVAAQMAADNRNPSLWLLGRSTLSSQQQTQLDALPARVHYRRVDVSDAAAVNKVVAEIRQTEGHLDGVIHAAGVIRDGLLRHKSQTDLSAVLAPKVAGLMNLDAAIGGEPLDFMVLFSSLSGALGNVGQGDYATANAFLDGFASHRNRLTAQGQRCGHTLSIDWPYLRDGGMQLDAAVVHAMEKNTGLTPLEPSAVISAMRAAMGFPDVDQLLIMDGDRPRLRRLMGITSSAPAAPLKSAAPTSAERLPARPMVSTRQHRMLAWVSDAFSQVLKIPAERLDADATIDRFGVDSISALHILEVLEGELGPLPQTLLFEHPTINALVDHLLAEYPDAMLDVAQSPKDERVDEHIDEKSVSPLQTKARSGDVAIIAVAGRYPGAGDVEALWQMLVAGRDGITEVPKSRWNADAHYSARKGKAGHSHCKWGGFIDDVDCFDANFFDYTPREASLLDPQERLFLETTWHLLERAGHTRAALQDRYQGRVGVFVGAMYQQYNAMETDRDSQSLLRLSSYAAIANRTSFFFDLQGPSVAVDSMCSSGLQAVHQACQSLQTGECQLAIAGGVNLSIHPDKYIGLSRLGLIGSHADSRAFAVDGDGYLPAEGVGAVLLKPLDEALSDQDPILAVIKGSIANHSGHSAGFAVPNIKAQARLMEENFHRSGIDPRSIGYVESSANGSPVGDAIERRALSRAFRSFTKDDGFCTIGSVKSFIGHAEAASGLAQLTKVLLQFQHRSLLPSFNDHTAAEVSQLFAGSPFVLQNALAPWARPWIDGQEQPRRATVSSFGAGGANVHVIVQEPPEPFATAENVPETNPLRQYPLFAKTPEQLRAVAERLEDYVLVNPHVSMARLSYTLRVGREPMACGVLLMAHDVEDLLKRLAEVRDGQIKTLETNFQLRHDTAETPLTPLPLPGYPFARDHHWIGSNESEHVFETRAPKAPVKQGAALLTVLVNVLATEQGVKPGRIDPTASLRAIGVDSMIGLQLIYAIEEATGIVVSHRELDQSKSLQHLAELVGAHTGQERLASPQTVHWDADGGPWQSVMGEGQKGIWVAQMLQPRSSVYNVPMAFRVKHIDLEVLQAACRWLLDRYPILTVRVADKEGEPHLVASTVEETVHSLSVPKGVDVLAFARQRVVRPFDMGEEAKIRFELISGDSLDAKEQLFLIVVHHLVTDGVSMAVMAREFWNAYERMLTGEAPALLSDAAQHADYADFIAWERAIMDSPEGARQRAFWQNQLAGVLPVLELPCDRKPDSEGLVDGRTCEMRLSKKVTKTVSAAADRLGISRASFYLGVFTILLYRYSGQNRMIVGVPTVRRPKRRFEETVGYCTNMMALPLDVKGSMRTKTLLSQVHQAMMTGMDHGDYPFASIARALGDTARGEPPYQVSYGYQNFSGSSAEMPVLSTGEVSYVPQLRQGGDGLFGLDLFDEASGLTVVAAFDGARFDPKTVNRMLEHFKALVVAVADKPRRRVASLSMLSNAEQKSLLRDWSGNTRSAHAPRLIADSFRRQVQKHPQAVAIVSKGKTVTYGQLQKQVNRLARMLCQRGLQPGDRVAVLLKREPASIAALLAVLVAGGVWVPLDANYPDQRLALILKDAKVSLVLSQGKLTARAVALGVTRKGIIDLKTDGKTIREMSAKSPKDKVHGADPAYIIYTSGSTGVPKGVVVSHGAIAEQCHVIGAYYGLGRKDVVLQFASHSVDTALEQILPTLVFGARLVLEDEEMWMPEDFHRRLHKLRITVVDLPPVYLRELLIAWSDGPTDRPALVLRLCIVGGETLAPDVVELWQNSLLSKVRLLNAYGPTEATVTALVHPVEPQSSVASIPIGQPLAGVEVYILDEDQNVVPEGVVGELYLSGSRLALGYHGNSKLTAERFVTKTLDPRRGAMRLYRTGDRASFIPDSQGTVAFHGRMDDQTSIRGFRVELGEIESALMAFGGCEAVVLPKSLADGKMAIEAFVVAMAPDFDRLGLDDFLRARLPAHMIPRRVRYLDVLPLTSGGKVDRTALLALPDEFYQVSAGRSKPSDEVEQRLLQVWEEVLSVEGETCPIGVDDSFERCGGNSLSAVRLLREIERRFEYPFSFAEFAKAPTIAAQARVLRLRRAECKTMIGEARESLLVPLRLPDKRADGRHPLFLIHPVSGSVTCYQALADRLNPKRPVYGVRAAEVEKRSDSNDYGISAMAQDYVAAIQEIQAQGPYLLAGWSFGGVVAFEMACQLRNKGEKVAFLGLLDSYPPEMVRQMEESLRRKKEFPGETAYWVQAFAQDLLGIENFMPKRSGSPLKSLLERAETVQLLPGVNAAQFQNLFELFCHNREALVRHTLTSCDFPLTLIHASAERGDDLGQEWRRIAGENITVSAVSGDHYSFLRIPFLDNWVNAFSEQIERIEQIHIE
ncbi:hypothetical protein BEN30_04620 [Magnetovibrio blakemorei]|uniref:Uncharacterized protein n=2 Tax=Magnetovibrio blakemorei TaxID=28181 RepID=A0A1E5QAJ5_9PROT|nr:hypothetical protein BEN30_04620 [Magnetovibrio blakemorei]